MYARRIRIVLLYTGLDHAHLVLDAGLSQHCEHNEVRWEGETYALTMGTTIMTIRMQIPITMMTRIFMSFHLCV